MSTLDATQQILLRFGAGWVLWALALLSAASLAIAIERLLFLRLVGADLRALAERLDGLLSSDQLDAAAKEMAASRSVAAQIAAAGLKLAHLGPASADKAMQSAIALHRGRLERGLAFLGTLGNNAPFIGLFGTVVGIIHAFEELGHGAPGHAAESTGSAASQVASQAVMGSISEALVATAVGILVALPAVAAYNYFQRRVTGLLQGTEVLSNLVLAYLSREPDPAPAAAPAKGGRSPRAAAGEG